MNVTPYISRCYRKSHNHGSPAPIVVELRDGNVRNIIYRNKRVLSGIPRYRDVYLHEHLTDYRQKLYNEVQTLPRPYWSSWTVGGVIFLLCKKPYKKYKITNYREYYEVIEDIGNSC